ncbi:integral membrane protein [Colletotrichum melonis]|uniref:Integral membrane protein n=1 Tax=Colletotrichum melonis TaxID=1209925 RepID=A0AAI9XXZ8_9PEZI|nr:integral membrane protein [Colletotrichum melonis]
MYTRTHTLSPLPTVLRHGLKAVVTLSFFSLVTSFTLLVYLIGRLACWYRRTSPKKEQQLPATTTQVPVIAGLPHELEAQYNANGQTKGSRVPNQFLILLLNVLFADAIQACAFFLDVVWLVEDKITDDSAACWAQGWFISTGDLASTAFVAFIAVHTYLTLVRGLKISCKAFYSTIFLLWFFVLFMSVLGVIITNNGAGKGGFYVRDITWCWINSEYEAMRMYLHYAWMLTLIITGTVSYVLVFVHVHRADKAFRSARKAAAAAEEASCDGVLSPTTLPNVMSQHNQKTEVHKRILFLFYPIVFLLCTAPLALGRILSSGGIKLSAEYLIFAGCMITSNGWIDVLIFSSTRSGILFDAPVDEQNVGLDTFNFTPLGQQYGHRVWIEGGASKDDSHNRKPSVFRRPSRRARLGSEASHDRSESQTSLHDRDVSGLKGIQMETVTRIFVEEVDPAKNKKYANRTLNSMPSDESVGERKSCCLSVDISAGLGSGLLPHHLHATHQPSSSDLRMASTTHQPSRGQASKTTTPLRQIRAYFDDETITVYQAYNAAIAEAAVTAQKLDASPNFKLSRMTWIKPSWAWMLYRAGYSYKDRGQERILAIKMTHAGFVDLLRQSVSTHGSDLEKGDGRVRVQWDPERDVRLEKLPYRSIQIGIPARICGSWVAEGIVDIEDVTTRARELKRVLDERPDVGDDELVALGLISIEKEFPVPEDVRDILGIDSFLECH